MTMLKFRFNLEPPIAIILLLYLIYIDVAGYKGDVCIP